MTLNKKTLIAVAFLAAFGAAHASKGGEGNNTGCNGQGNANSPCAGTPGPTGPQGPKGDTGAQGPKGDTGAPGANGRDGTNGRDGKDGVATAGKDGAEGKPGASITGATGATGAAGRDATLPADIVTQSQLSSATQQLSERIEANDKRASAGTAAAIGIASIPQAVDVDSAVVGAGAGYYRGESGLAVGMSWRNKAGDWISKAAVTVDSRGSAGLGVGAAFSWR